MTTIPKPPTACTTRDDFLLCRGRELQAIYATGSSEPIPRGTSRGVALMLPGTPVARPLAWMVRVFGWKGKVFAADGTSLKNLITPFGIPSIRAAVYPGASLLDGQPSIILDYSKTSWIARFVRDEIREVSPGLYLGYAYVFGIRWIAFGLQFDSEPPNLPAQGNPDI